MNARSCLRRIKEAEAKRGKPYEYVLRLRADGAFPCKIAPPDAWPAIVTQRSLLFFLNEAFLTTRPFPILIRLNFYVATI